MNIVNKFSPLEIQRYARHFAIPNFGIKAQEKLKRGKVLVVGAGGLGSPLLLYLAAAGVGEIGIIDFDSVDLTNLQRQILFNEADLNKSKAKTAKERLLLLNSHIKITAYEEALTPENALQIIENFDIVADGTDNFPARYLVNDACVLLGKVNVYASIFRFEGQVSVFNFLNEDRTRGPNYRDIFPEPPPPDLVPNCAEGGVLGVLPGIIGSMQATEVIKVLTGFGEPLVGKLFLFDATDFSTQIIKIRKNPHLTITKLIDYQVFCKTKSKSKNDLLKEISVSDLKKWQNQKHDFQLIDVRETYEFEMGNLGGQSIPLNTISKNITKISSTKKVVLYCQSGKRSAKAIEILQSTFGFNNLYNLSGGILAWAEKTKPYLDV